ncbi:MAG: hypothetical protein ABI454_03630 [Sphingomicrobium sp.]
MGGMTHALWALKEINDAYEIASAEGASADGALSKILPKLRQAQNAADESAKNEDELYREIWQLKEEVRQLKERIDRPNS